MSIAWTADDRALLAKLNEGSWSRTFSPQDVDWSATTTHEELAALYRKWSLFLGTPHDDALTDEQRVRFARYQQMNLMQFTALFERCGLATFESFYGEDDDAAYQEYVAHFIKEETYHYVLFRRAIARLREDDPQGAPLPARPLRWFLAVAYLVVRALPSRVRRAAAFSFLRFAEEVSLQAHRTASDTIAPTSLVAKVWALHALDEARHVAFDDLMIRRAAVGKLGLVVALPLCVAASLLLNLNELWAARQVGVRVGYLELPSLMRRTTAPFKRAVFALLRKAA